MPRTVIIDGDILVYRISEASTESFDLSVEEDEDCIYHTVSWGNKHNAIDMIDKFIEDIKQRTKSTEYILCLSDAQNFRKNINPSYKGNRRAIKPCMWEWIRKHLIENYRVLMKDNLEADDTIGILATSTKIIKGDKVIWSLDKDFKTIPCIFFRGEEKPIMISEEEADWWFMYQTLVGDSTDGYKGCKGIGDKIARKILGDVSEKSLEEMWRLVVETYEKSGFSREDALLNARMARILRVKDYNFKTKEVKLWQPNI